MTRKSFLYILVRSSILAVMVSLTAVFISRGKLSCPGDTASGSFCGSCDLLDGCRLPGAKKFINHGRGKTI